MLLGAVDTREHCGSSQKLERAAHGETLVDTVPDSGFARTVEQADTPPATLLPEARTSV